MLSFASLMGATSLPAGRLGGAVLGIHGPRPGGVGVTLRDDARAAVTHADDAALRVQRGGPAAEAGPRRRATKFGAAAAVTVDQITFGVRPGGAALGGALEDDDGARRSAAERVRQRRITADGEQVGVAAVAAAA